MSILVAKALNTPKDECQVSVRVLPISLQPKTQERETQRASVALVNEEDLPTCAGLHLAFQGL